MADQTTPLLAGSRPSLTSSHQSPNDGGDASPAQRRAVFSRCRVDGWPIRLSEVVLLIWAILATVAVVVLAVFLQQSSQGRSDPPAPSLGKRNLIFMVSDGMGPASLSLTRSFRQHVDGLPIDDTLVLDRHLWGSSRTRSSSSLVTDSAAGATAFSCGKKSYNGAISMLPDSTPCGSVLEAAKMAGYLTGMVVTTDITDATPACFASHVYFRFQNDEIAAQEIGESVLGRSTDLLFGGGRCHFLPNTTAGSCRLDDLDVVAVAQKKHGWSFAHDRAGFDAMRGGNNVSLPALGLFAAHDVPFEIDRQSMSNIYPSLSEMATTALHTLHKASEANDKGFFLMIEGSRIDHAAHYNDPAAHVHEVLEYDKTFQAVLDFVAESNAAGVETVVVATSDHETGGLAAALQKSGHQPVYNWYPTVLAHANTSAELLAKLLAAHVAQVEESPTDLQRWINEELVVAGLGITDALDDELEALARNTDASLTIFSHMISQRAHIGWSTHGHTAVDVNIYSSGGPAIGTRLRGNVENTDVGHFLRDFLDVDVDAVTALLRKRMDLQPPPALDDLDALAQAIEAGPVGPLVWDE